MKIMATKNASKDIIISCTYKKICYCNVRKKGDSLKFQIFYGVYYRSK